jgi:hypothetical protein
MDEVHGLLQRAIQTLDEGMREAKAEEGLEELPAGDQEARKAMEFLVEKGTQLFMMIDAMANRDWSPPADEPQGGRGGGKRFKPSRK